MSGADAAIAAAADRVAAGMREGAPQGWRELRLATSHVLSVASYVLEALMPDGTWLRFANFSDDLYQGGRELRSACYIPGRGTWYLMRLHIDARGVLTYDVDYDADPAPVEKFTANSYVHDVAHFLRDDQHTPPWLVATLAEADKRLARNAAARARRAARTAERRAARETAASTQSPTAGDQP